MIRQMGKAPIPPGIPFVLAGFYLAARSGILLAAARWRPDEVAPFLAAASAATLCDAFFAIKFRRKFTPWAAACGAALVTLSAGTPARALFCWLPDLLFAGGVAAYFVRTRKKNTFFPFAAGFAAGLAAVFLQAPRLGHAVCASSAMLLSGVLIVNAVHLKHARWLLLTMILMQVMFFANDFPVGRAVERLRLWRERDLAALAALPSSPIPDAEPGRLSVLQVTRQAEDIPAAPWKQFSYISRFSAVPVEGPVPVGKRLDALGTPFDLISLEVLPKWPEASLQSLTEKLLTMTAKKGCLVVPRALVPLLPPDRKTVPVPGTGRGRFAVLSASDASVSPQTLDSRLQRHLKAAGDKTFMPAGVFTALFLEKDDAAGKSLPAPARSLPGPHSALFWSLLAFAGLALHIFLSRSRAGSSFLAEAENASSCALIVTAAFLTVAANRMNSLIPETALLWSIVLCLPFCGKKGKLEKLLLGASLLLPWLLAAELPQNILSAAALAIALVTAASAGITGAKLLLEPEASRDRLVMAFFCGTALAGGLLFLLPPASPIPLLAAATTLRLPVLFRS
ncbi:MAG: hypothetical protein IJS01_05825 [Lentisphaeria bacterium]|nr:hypothetical protein [Lentisphaeria bacterium]